MTGCFRQLKGVINIETTVNNTRIVLLKGDITEQDTDAIVNAANSTLLGGGGVDGAIHRAGGPQILEECKLLAAKQGGCRTGEAVITTGGKLKAKYVIHAVGPVWHGDNAKESQLLRNAYHNSLRLAKENKVRTISFPSISTGAYRFPFEQAAEIALRTGIDFAKTGEMDEIRFVLFSEGDYQKYRKVLLKLMLSI